MRRGIVGPKSERDVFHMNAQRGKSKKHSGRTVGDGVNVMMRDSLDIRDWTT